MKWFKFYGQDFVADPKMGALTTAQRLIWVYLLSMASLSEKKDGVLPFITLDHLRQLAGIGADDENWKLTDGTFELFEEMKLIEWTDEHTLKITNYEKYQETQLTDAERAKKYRDNKKIKLNVTTVTEGVTKRHTRDRYRDRDRKDNNDTKYKKGSVRENITSQTARSLEEKKAKDQKEAEVLTEALYTAKAIKVDYEKLERSDKASFLYVFIKAKTNVEILKNIKQAMLPIAEYGRPISNNARARLFIHYANNGVLLETRLERNREGNSSIKAIIAGAILALILTLALNLNHHQLLKATTAPKAQAASPTVKRLKAPSAPTQTIPVPTTATIKPERQHISDQNIEQEICDVFGPDCRVAIAIAKAESGLNCNAVSPTNDHGVFQLNAVHMPKFNGKSPYDCKANIEVAYRIFKEQGFGPWAAYTNKSFLKFL